MVVLGLLWIPFMKFISGTLYKYLQSVQSYISPPIAAVFLLGVFYKRVNSKSAITALISGFVLGMLRLVLELNKENLSGFLYSYADINFLHFAVYLFSFCVILMLVVSFVSESPTIEKIKGLTFATTAEEDRETLRESWNWIDVVLSILITLIIVFIYIYFVG